MGSRVNDFTEVLDRAPTDPNGRHRLEEVVPDGVADAYGRVYGREQLLAQGPEHTIQQLLHQTEKNDIDDPSLEYLDTVSLPHSLKKRCAPKKRRYIRIGSLTIPFPYGQPSPIPDEKREKIRKRRKIRLFKRKRRPMISTNDTNTNSAVLKREKRSTLEHLSTNTVALSLVRTSVNQLLHGASITTKRNNDTGKLTYLLNNRVYTTEENLAIAVHLIRTFKPYTQIMLQGTSNELFTLFDPLSEYLEEEAKLDKKMDYFYIIHPPQTNVTLLSQHTDPFFEAANQKFDNHLENILLFDLSRNPYSFLSSFGQPKDATTYSPDTFLVLPIDNDNLLYLLIALSFYKVTAYYPRVPISKTKTELHIDSSDLSVALQLVVNGEKPMYNNSIPADVVDLIEDDFLELLCRVYLANETNVYYKLEPGTATKLEVLREFVETHSLDKIKQENSLSEVVETEREVSAAYKTIVGYRGVLCDWHASQCSSPLRMHTTKICSIFHERLHLPQKIVFEEFTRTNYFLNQCALRRNPKYDLCSMDYILYGEIVHVDANTTIPSDPQIEVPLETKMFLWDIEEAKSENKTQTVSREKRSIFSFGKLSRTTYRSPPRTPWGRTKVGGNRGTTTWNRSRAKRRERRHRRERRRRKAAKRLKDKKDRRDREIRKRCNRRKRSPAPSDSCTGPCCRNGAYPKNNPHPPEKIDPKAKVSSRYVPKDYNPSVWDTNRKRNERILSRKEKVERTKRHIDQEKNSELRAIIGQQSTGSESSYRDTVHRVQSNIAQSSFVMQNNLPAPVRSNNARASSSASSDSFHPLVQQSSPNSLPLSMDSYQNQLGLFELSSINLPSTDQKYYGHSNFRLNGAKPVQSNYAQTLGSSSFVGSGAPRNSNINQIYNPTVKADSGFMNMVVETPSGATTTVPRVKDRTNQNNWIRQNSDSSTDFEYIPKKALHGTIGRGRPTKPPRSPSPTRSPTNSQPENPNQRPPKKPQPTFEPEYATIANPKTNPKVTTRPTLAPEEIELRETGGTRPGRQSQTATQRPNSRSDTSDSSDAPDSPPGAQGIRNRQNVDNKPTPKPRSDEDDIDTFPDPVTQRSPRTPTKKPRKKDSDPDEEDEVPEKKKSNKDRLEEALNLGNETNSDSGWKRVKKGTMTAVGSVFISTQITSSLSQTIDVGLNRAYQSDQLELQEKQLEVSKAESEINSKATQFESLVEVMETLGGLREQDGGPAKRDVSQILEVIDNYQQGNSTATPYKLMSQLLAKGIMERFDTHDRSTFHDVSELPIYASDAINATLTDFEHELSTISAQSYGNQEELQQARNELYDMKVLLNQLTGVLNSTLNWTKDNTTTSLGTDKIRPGHMHWPYRVVNAEMLKRDEDFMVALLNELKTEQDLSYNYYVSIGTIFTLKNGLNITSEMFPVLHTATQEEQENLLFKIYHDGWQQKSQKNLLASVYVNIQELMEILRVEKHFSSLDHFKRVLFKIGHKQHMTFFKDMLNKRKNPQQNRQILSNLTHDMEFATDRDILRKILGVYISMIVKILYDVPEIMGEE